MSQLTLTPEEDALVCSALRAKSAQYLAMFGVTDPAIDALLAKVEGQLPQPEPAEVAIAEAEAEALEAAEEVKATKTRKAKAAVEAVEPAAE
jgi:hypothetical protein